MKKGIPVGVLQKIQPIINENRALIRIVQDEKRMFSLEDEEIGSGFYFKAGFPNTEHVCLLEFAPISTFSNKPEQINASVDNIPVKLADWLRILQAYVDTPDIFDDPILRSYEAEFAEYFNVRDEDMEEDPLDLPRQLYLTAYLEQMETQLREKAETASPRQKTQLLLIEQECASMRETMGESTKGKTARKMVSILAKARKYSISLLTEFFTELRKEGYKQIAKGIFTTDLSTITHMLDSLG